MSYNSKLEQTNRRVARARRKYYGSFDYGSGFKVRNKGGLLHFSRKFDKGGNKMSEGGFEKLGALSGFLTVGQGAADILTSGTPYGEWQANTNRTYSDLNKYIGGISDNSALLNAYDTMPYIDAPTNQTFYDRSVSSDIFGTIGSGITGAISGSKFGGVPGAIAGGLISAGLTAGSAIGKRLSAASNARMGSKYVNSLNQSLATKLAKAGDAIDKQNDLQKMAWFMANNYDAFGGNLTHGANFDTGLTFIEEGGKHETNPNGGVPAGIDDEGIPNLVEEGEVIWNNEYVFSDRTKVPKELKEKYKLEGNPTFADAIEKLTEGSDLLVNDPIRKRTNEAIVNEFRVAQEEIRTADQARAYRELKDAQDMEFMDTLGAMQGMQQAQPQSIQEIPVEEETLPIQDIGMTPPGYAYGGTLFKGGGHKVTKVRQGLYKVGDKEFKDFIEAQSYANLLNGVSTDIETYTTDDGKVFTTEEEALAHAAELDRARQSGMRDSTDEDDYENALQENKIYFGRKVKRKNALDVKNTQPTIDPFDFTIETQPFDFTEADNINEDVIKAASNPNSRLRNSSIANILNRREFLIKHPNAAEFDASHQRAYADVPETKLKQPDGFNDRFTGNGELESELENLSSLRTAPVWGTGLATLYGLLGSPDYSNADAIINEASRLGTPVSMPIETLGDYVSRRPFDERYLVNQATQARNAAYRGAMNTAGGNRAMQLGAQAFLAGNYQNNLAEIMRQAYLANRQDELATAEFNRGTNSQNMQAINARNAALAQLNSQRQQAAFSGLSHGYGLRQSIKNDWDESTRTSLNSFLNNLGLLGKEDAERIMADGVLREGYDYVYNPKTGKHEYVKSKAGTVSAKGGNLKKKRRF